MTELPRGWAASTLVEACELVQDCEHRTPKYSDAGIPALRPRDVHLLNGPGREHALASQAGSAHPHLNLSDIRATPVLLAPLAEQERIVAAIEEAFSKLDGR